MKFAIILFDSIAFIESTRKEGLGRKIMQKIWPLLITSFSLPPTQIWTIVQDLLFTHPL